MHKLLFSCYLMLFLLCSCSNGGEEKEKFNKTKSADDMALVGLASQMIANPKNQKDKDQNAIIDYALAKGLEMERHSSGIYFQVLEHGEGKKPKGTDDVTVHYKGSLLNDKVFDSSYQRGQAISFKLTQVIEGWQIGIPFLQEGGKAILLIPSGLAYGPNGFASAIPPNSPLRFDVELLKVE